MAIAHQTRFEAARRESGSRDVTIMLGYSIFAILLVIGIYWAARACGTAPGDLALMTVFP